MTNVRCLLVSENWGMFKDAWTMLLTMHYAPWTMQPEVQQ